MYHFWVTSLAAKDLKPDNIMYSAESGAAKLTLIDYGLIRTCAHDDAEAQSSALQLLRWFGWQFLWMLASEAFSVDNPDKNPWQQLPDGFRPFFQPSDLRPSAYRTCCSGSITCTRAS